MLLDHVPRNSVGMRDASQLSPPGSGCPCRIRGRILVGHRLESQPSDPVYWIKVDYEADIDAILQHALRPYCNFNRLNAFRDVTNCVQVAEMSDL